LDKTAKEWARRGIALAAIVGVVLCHALVPKFGVRVMNCLAWLKILTLVFVIIAGWVVLGGKVQTIPDPKSHFVNSFAGSEHNINAYASALFKVMFSFAG
jgi:L-type amino acid transporter 9